MYTLILQQTETNETRNKLRQKSKQKKDNNHFSKETQIEKNKADALSSELLTRRCINNQVTLLELTNRIEAV